MTFDADLFDELATTTGHQLAPGGKVDAILSNLPDRDRDILLKYLRNEHIGSRRLSRLAKRSGLDLGREAISSWREKDKAGGA